MILSIHPHFQSVVRNAILAASADHGQGDGHSDEDGSGIATIGENSTSTRERTKTPPLYRVILMNDDYTPMDFVIHVLQKFFAKDIPEATRIMLEIHTKGAGVCGTFTYEIAETKVYLVNNYSKENRYPLKCTLELS